MTKYKLYIYLHIILYNACQVKKWLQTDDN